MEWLCFLFFLAMAAAPIAKAITEAARRKEQDEMKQQHPELWVQLKQLEVEERLMEHQKEQQKQQIRHDQLKTGIGFGATLLRILTKQ